MTTETDKTGSMKSSFICSYVWVTINYANMFYGKLKYKHISTLKTHMS